MHLPCQVMASNSHARLCVTHLRWHGATQDMGVEVHEGQGVLHQLKSAWHARLGRVAGLELQDMLGRGGFASVFKGGSEPTHFPAGPVGWTKP